jgi:hypothetical protein
MTKSNLGKGTYDYYNLEEPFPYIGYHYDYHKDRKKALQ